MAAKTDNDKYGVFSQSSYVTVGDKYPAKGVAGPFNHAAYKGKQFGGGKRKEEYFKPFERVFGGEASSDPVKLRRKYLAKEKEKMRGKGFFPVAGTKKVYSGSYQGTLGGKVEAMAPTQRKPKAYEAPKRNFYSKPAPEGAGGTVPNLGFGKDPEFKGSPFDAAEQIRLKELAKHNEQMAKRGKKYNSALFPNKPLDTTNKAFKPPDKMPKEKPATAKPKAVLPFKPGRPPGTMESGGNLATTFGKFMRNEEKWRQPKKAPKEKVFRPLPSMKSAPMKSIEELSVRKSVNAANFQSIPVAL